MLMALESGELAAGVIGDHLGAAADYLEASFRAAYKTRFDSRLRISSMIRRAAFVPGLARMAIGVFAASERLRRRVSRATRSHGPETFCLSERLDNGR
jgi:hypothetical protein